MIISPERTADFIPLGSDIGIAATFASSIYLQRSCPAGIAPRLMLGEFVTAELPMVVQGGQRHLSRLRLVLYHAHADHVSHLVEGCAVAWRPQMDQWV